MRGSPGEDLLAHDLRLEIEDHVADRARRIRRCIGGQHIGGSALVDFLQRLLARLLLAHLVCVAELALDGLADPGEERLVLGGRLPVPFGLPPSSTSEWMRSITACCCW
jgi:hypothetical protein